MSISLANSNPAIAPAEPTFDDRGMPLTVVAARQMDASSIDRALTASIARLKRRTPAAFRASSKMADDGTPALDSQIVFWALAEFSKPFKKPVIDLTKIPDRTKWSSMGALSELIKEHM
jgi:hypothetical protein